MHELTATQNIVAGQDKAQKALELFQQAYEKKKSPRVLLFIADAYAEMAKYDDALKILDEFTNRFVREEALIPLAHQKMVALQLKKGSKDEALKTLDRISGASGDMLKDFALIQQARMLEQDGKKDEAIANTRSLLRNILSPPILKRQRQNSARKRKDN